MENNLKPNEYKIKPKIFKLLVVLLIYIFFGLFLFLFFRSKFILLFLIAYFVIILFSFISIVVSKKKINVLLNISEEKIECEDKIGISINYSNHSIFPFLKCVCTLKITNTFYNESSVLNVSIPLQAKDSSSYPVIFDTYRCGQINVSLEQIKIYDYCSLFYIFGDKQNDVIVNILPKHELIEEPDAYTIFAGMEDNEDTTKKGNEHSDVSNIREYVVGDRIKDIHWKLSVKRDVLLVKERVKSAENKISMWMDSNNDKDLCESYLLTTYNLINYTITNNIVTLLIWFNYKTKEINKYYINSKTELDDCFVKIYESSRGHAINDLQQLLMSYNIETSNLIRITFKDGKTGAFLFQE